MNSILALCVLFLEKLSPAQKMLPNHYCGFSSSNEHACLYSLVYFLNFIMTHFNYAFHNLQIPHT